MSRDAFIDAGQLNQLVRVLELRETSAGVWEWQEKRKAWASVQLEEKKNLFSSIGIGARDVTMILRRQSINEHNAILWKGQHCFLTSVVEEGRLHLRVKAALVQPVECRRHIRKKPAEQFPGILTEKYLKHEQLTPMSRNVLQLALVTPKAITLNPGDLVETQGVKWEVTVAHTLDQFKNEYEIERTVDL